VCVCVCMRAYLFIVIDIIRTLWMGFAP